MHPSLTRTLRLLGLLETGRRVELRLRMRQPRALPGAVILGAQKCGTSSLHNYLTQHPGVIAPLRKEVHYFDVNYRARRGVVSRAFRPPGRAGTQPRQQPLLPVPPGRAAAHARSAARREADRAAARPGASRVLALLARARQGPRGPVVRGRDRGGAASGWRGRIEVLASGEIEASREHQLHSLPRARPVCRAARALARRCTRASSIRSCVSRTSCRTRSRD